MTKAKPRDKAFTRTRQRGSLAVRRNIPRHSRGPFYELLKKAFPRCVKKTGSQKLSLSEAAGELGITQQALGVSVRSNHCSVKLAKQIVAKGQRRVRLEELYEFVFK